MHNQGEIPQIYHAFALFDSPKNGSHLMIPLYSHGAGQPTRRLNVPPQKK